MIQPRSEALRAEPELPRAGDAVPLDPAPTSAATDRILVLLLRKWLTILMAMLAAVVIGAALGALQPKQYRASSVAAVVTTGSNAHPDELFRGMEVLEQRTIISTVAALVTLPATLEQAWEGHEPAKHYAINATVLPMTNLIRIDVDGGDPSVAAVIANRVPLVLNNQVHLMYGVYGVRTMSQATLPATVIGPRLFRIVIMAAVLGFIIGIGLVIAMDVARRKQIPAPA